MQFVAYKNECVPPTPALFSGDVESPGLRRTSFIAVESLAINHYVAVNHRLRQLRKRTNRWLPSRSLQTAITPDDRSSSRSSVSMSNPARIYSAVRYE